jgi:hypothetical protein
MDADASNDFHEWVKAEFEQSYQQLRDRDSIIVDLTKFYGGLICAVCAAANVLFGISGLPAKSLLIGAFLIISGVIGAALLMWLVAFRVYFVFTARHLNALRGHATRGLSPEDRKRFVILATDPTYPQYWHRTSAHIAICLVVSFVNAVVIGAGVFGVMYYWLQQPFMALEFTVGAVVAAALFAASVAYCKASLKER